MYIESNSKFLMKKVRWQGDKPQLENVIKLPSTSDDFSVLESAEEVGARLYDWSFAIMDAEDVGCPILDPTLLQKGADLVVKLGRKGVNRTPGKIKITNLGGGRITLVET